ncbi:MULTISPECIES: radical SAM protein [unclassified Mesorhizobium]|uniref:B12-binding domain-containing radical SAM protein n=1 Tax=unclassified Mesorhizobium TaxID=325217 RepID=UPI000FDC1203|nr:MULTISPECIES: radical SAM protein [unclassified Mesorhizobium]TGR39953.1 radical SAM protein [bacterium M00.F.Ca.ET.199.01.1.1]TGU24158.1 radical SAM protein [bacterium M00.F.Ca.ET.156.01.1.1]TGV89372.1 radical SAM protein [Mesorhizobium sp. M00.F.Ca.ET.149.01.1.1]TGR23330.1 radical SAM protein [Mesorhizobium sp. M8A.F.Ca.ET.202.01.1.1]TGR24563.1 radical SAM protein [Mesorhizobium sp. M8A.F.Ca.ET.197.01.1.1]
MNIGLVFPPPFDLTQPYLSLPMLASFLRRRGNNVVVRDLNVAFYNHVLSKSYLLKAHQAALDIAKRGDILDSDPEWQNLLSRALTLGPFIANEIDNAKAELRDQIAFFDPKRYARNFRLIHRGCDMLSAVFPPSRITPVSFRVGCEPESISDLLELAKSDKSNPFAAVFAEHLVPELVGQQLDVIGVSVVYSHQIIPALTLARVLKAAAPLLPVIVGGEVFSKMVRLPEVRMTQLFEFIDGIVLDDGRTPLLALCEGAPLDEIPGVITRGASKPISKMPLPLESIDSFGTPDFGDLPMKEYFAPPKVMPLLSGKGCQYAQCLFCSESFTKDYAPQSIELVIKAIETLVHEHGATCITFADVDIPPDRLSALADLLIQRRIEVTWSCYARLTRRMDLQLCTKLARAGCRRIHFGFESASQRILKLMRKGTQISVVPGILDACWAAGISPHLFSFVGFPGETREEATLTADFFVAHHQTIGSFNIGAFALLTFAEMYAKADSFGLKSTRTRAPEGDAFDHPYRVRGGMDIDEVKSLATELTQFTYERITKAGGPFQLYPGNYVCREGVPPWNSHALAYLSHHGPSFNSLRGRAVELPSGNPDIPIKTDFVELESEANGSTLIYNPSNGKLLTLKPRLLWLLECCNGTNSLEEILERASRHGIANNHAIRALNQAAREDLVTFPPPKSDDSECVGDNAFERRNPGSLM